MNEIPPSGAEMRGDLPGGDPGHPQDDGGRQRRRAQCHLPGAAPTPSPALARGEGPPGRDQPTGGDHGGARRHRHGRRGTHREPREVPRAAHLPSAALRGRLPHPAAAQPHPGPAVARPRARCRGGGVAHRGGLQPQAEPGHCGGGAARGGGLYRIHVADPVAFRRGTGRGLSPRAPWTPPPGAPDGPSWCRA